LEPVDGGTASIFWIATVISDGSSRVGSIPPAIAWRSCIAGDGEALSPAPVGALKIPSLGLEIEEVRMDTGGSFLFTG